MRVYEDEFMKRIAGSIMKSIGNLAFSLGGRTLIHELYVKVCSIHNLIEREQGGEKADRY